MQFTHLGRSGLQVSRLCLGTMNFGGQASEADSHAIMDKALELGVNFFDTANVYGSKPNEGVTEQIIGSWFTGDPGRRHHVVLATKVYGRMGLGPNDRKLSARHIRQACDESLRRLKTDHIDLYQMHHVDRSTTWEEIWQAMEGLVAAGKVLYVGSSNFAGWHIARASETAARRNFMGIVSEQSRYSLMVREPELEVLPACLHYGIGVIPYSPIGGGLLGGVLGSHREGRRSSEGARKIIEQRRAQLERWEDLCNQLGEAPANVALGWQLANPAITAPIIGPRTMDQMTGVMRALDVALDESTLKKIDEIWPGPGGAAPEAYAW